MAKFNVLTEPWIPVVDLRGELREYGLIDVITKAHEFDAIRDPAPPIQFGIYRLLVTFVQRAYRIFDHFALEDAFDEGRFDETVLEEYIYRIGERRFDLFDSQNPFLQTCPRKEDEKKIKSIVEIFFHIPGGTNVTHFHHTMEDEHGVVPAVAARGLCSISPFMIQGGQGYSPSINGTPPWYVLPKGENLFETILLNVPVMQIPGIRNDGVPVWETDANVEPKKEKGVESFAEAFTWQPRRVRLLVDEQRGECTYSGEKSPILIRRIVWDRGYKFDQYEGWRDPNVAYINDKRRGIQSLRPQEKRQLWRDYDALFLMSERSQKARPNVIDQLEYLKNDDVIPRDRVEPIEVYGLRAKQAKIFEWYYDIVSVNHNVLKNQTAAGQVELALGLSEDVATALERALRRLSPQRGKNTQNIIASVISYALEKYWDSMGRFFESEYLRYLAEQNEHDEEERIKLLNRWKGELRTVGWRVLEEAVEGSGTDADALIKQEDAKREFAKYLKSKISIEE